MPPPRTVDYQPESDELALLQTLEGGPEGEADAQDADEEAEGDGGDLEAARRKRVRPACTLWHTRGPCPAHTALRCS